MLMLASGGAELVSLGAVLPFLAVLSSPERLWKHPFVQSLASTVGFKEANDLFLPATILFSIAAVLASLIRLANLWLNGRMAAAIGSDLSCEAYKRTLYQPYSVHVQQNSSTVITGTSTHIMGTVQAFAALLQLLTSLVVSTGLLAGMLLIDWPIALGSITLFGSVYVLLSIYARKELQSNGKRIAQSAKLQIKALQEGLGAIRDVLLDSNQPIYVDIYRQADRPQRQLIAKNQFIFAFPRYAVEALGLVAIALCACLLVFQKGSGNAAIPILGAMALGAQRLLPAFQQIYAGWSRLKSCNADLTAVTSMINLPLPPLISVAAPLVLEEGIRLESVHFAYGQGQSEVLRGINFEIRSGERIGFIGSTGSGKSTIADLIMGLLVPTAGRILIDGVDLHDPNYPERLVSWRRAIAHVPQSIYLSDKSIVENIAFGVPCNNININLVKEVAEKAQLTEFIEGLKHGFDSHVGERGIRLSGGERQRLGIARALYKQAKVIVLDEATSALDNETESVVIEKIEEFNRSTTIIMIAHRLTTLSHCDRLAKLSNGCFLAVGSPDTIL
jgi:ATP-binding cassette subfamily B protein